MAHQEKKFASLLDHSNQQQHRNQSIDFLKQKVKTINKKMSAIEALQEGSLKDQYIAKYGIQLEMPAIYIYESFFYRPNNQYVINVYCQIFPSEVKYLDFNKLEQNEDPRQNDFIEQQREFSNLLCFKVFQLDDSKYSQIAQRKCEISYQHKLCFSEDKTRVAVFRLEKTKKDDPHPKSLKPSTTTKGITFFKQNQNYVIDIFDCSSIDFFMKEDPLSPEDPSLLFTIRDEEMQSVHKFENSFLRFSAESKYFYINQQRKTILIYQLEDSEKDIYKPLKQVTIPSIYEDIVNIGIDEYDLENSLIAAKKTDFRNIEVFPLKMLLQMAELQNNSFNKSASGQAELHKIRDNYPVSSIRIENFDLSRANMRFSQDMTQAIYCDDTQHVLLELAQEGMKQHQKSINHLKTKTTRHIQRYGDSEFLITTADSQDKSISIRHSSDPKKKIKFYFRFKEGSTSIRDVYHFDDKVRILVTRDDEEFIIYEYQNFHTKETFWQRFFENSNYIFEWPYLCYLKGQNHIIIQNAFNTKLIFFLELANLTENGIISNMFVSDQYLLYLIVSTKTEYLIYEKDLDKVMPYIFEQMDGEDQSPGKSTKNQLTSKISQTKPIARISKDYLGFKSIYKVFVRSPSNKEVVQINQDRIIFFLCNFKIYSIINGKVEIVDSGYKFREVKPNLLAYNRVDSNNKKTNEICLLQIAFSDYQKMKIYEETEGKLLEYLVQDGQLLCVVKPEKGSEHFIKIFDIDNLHQVKLKYSILTEDKEFIRNLQTLNYYQGNMIPANNDLYTLVHNGDKALFHHYKNVIPSHPNSGNSIAFYSPLINILYRKMIYFVTNKKFLKTKRAIILPYITDNFTQFNRRTNMTHFCTFHEHKQPYQSEGQIDILCYVPFTQHILHYNLKGQLRQIKHLKEEQMMYGETTVAVSQNGKIFLQKFEDEISRSNLHILEKYIDYKVDEDLNDVPDDELLSGENQGYNNLALNKGLTMKLNNIITHQHAGTTLKLRHVENIRLDQIKLEDEKLQELNKFYVNEYVQFFVSQGCEVVYKVNDKLDVLIGFLHQVKAGPQKTINNKVLKELILIKKQYGSDSRQLYKVRPENLVKESSLNSKSQSITIDRQTTKKAQELKQTLFQNMQVLAQHDRDFEYTAFLSMHELNDCQDFTITNDKVILWSKTKIYSGDLSNVNSNKKQMTLKKVLFEIENHEEAQIANIYSSGQNTEDYRMSNYYVYIKVCVENSYAFIIKYNIDKNKEFSSFDCSLDSQIFFDNNHEGFIFDNESIIDSDQGIPLYFYKTGMKDYNKSYLINGDISKGPRFCSKNQHFMIRNRVYLPYSYFTLIIFDHFKGKPITNETYDPDAFYFFNGETVLHNFANNYKSLEFILEKYEQTKPSLLNLLLIKDNNNKNVLQKALENGNTRCVKLILDKLSSLSMNNIHAVKQNFCDLLEYNGFEDYLRLCFFKTRQMQAKLIFQRKSDSQDSKLYICPNQTSFLDKNFYENFQDTTQPMKQVVIRALDAGWILRSDYGQQFLIALSDSDNMDYFAIDTIKLMVRFQWNIMKPKIIYWLFIPFIINMVLYSVYCIYSYEDLIASKHSEKGANAFNIINQVLILLFTIQTGYIEFKQMTFHKKEYFKSFWNLLDLTTIILAPLTVIMDFADVDPTSVRPIMAICNLIFYLRFFYFLRIFDSSSNLVRTIIEITSDIRNFLFVFLMAIIGLGGSFMILSNNNDPKVDGAQFISSLPNGFIYTYRITLGDFDLDPYSQSTDEFLLYFFFILSSLFSAVILLNMLVAIMGESFNRVNEASEFQRVREHLQLIVENDFLISRNQIFKDVKYLIEIKDDIEDDSQDLIQQNLIKLTELHQVIVQTHKETISTRSEMKHVAFQNSLKVEQIRAQVNEIARFLNQQRAEGNDQVLNAMDTMQMHQSNFYNSRNSVVMNDTFNSYNHSTQ